MLSKRVRADLALGLCALIWGSSFVVVKDAFADISGVAYLAVRFAIAAVLMGAIYWRSIRQLTWQTAWAGMQIGFFMFGGYVFQVAGLKLTTPSKAAFITGSGVVLVPILLAVFGRRRITAWIWSGALAAFSGLYFLAVPREGLGALNRGDPLVFVCAVLFALHLIFIGRHVPRHSVGALSFLQVATTAALSVALVPISAASGWEQPRFAWSSYLIFAVLLTAIGATVIGFSLQTWAQQYASPSHAAILVSLEPVFAALTSFVVGGEHPGARTLFGAALILIGILVAEWKAPSVPESPVPAVSATE